MNKKLPISAIVVVYNEAHLLSKCLERLAVCDELVVVDLGSEDKSVEIAKRYATKIILSEKYPYVEKALHAHVEKLKHKWVLHIDPDELLDVELLVGIEKYIGRNDLAVLCVPWIFYFKNEKLGSTFWGRPQFKRVLYNRENVTFQPLVHNAVNINFGRVENIRALGVLHHYWMSTNEQLIEKHKRYIEGEGLKRFDNGERYSFIKKISASSFGILKNLFWYKGVLGGFTGIYLSFFYGWYVWNSHVSLKRYQILAEKKKNK